MQMKDQWPPQNRAFRAFAEAKVSDIFKIKFMNVVFLQKKSIEPMADHHPWSNVNTT